MSNDFDPIFWFSILLLTIYWLRLLRTQPLGASHIFVGLVLFYHGPALIFYRDIWYGEFGLGLLGSLNNPESTSNAVILGMSICFLSLFTGLKFADKMLFRIRPHNGNNMHARMSKHYTQRLRQAAFASIVFIILVLCAQYLFIAGPEKIYDYYVADVSDFDRFRIRRESNINFYPYGVLIGTIIPFISFILFANVSKSKSKNMLFIFFAMASAILLAKFSQYTKAGPTLYFLQLIFCTMLAKREVIFVGKNEVFFVVIALLAITAMVTFVGDGVEIIVVFDRLLMIPNEVIFEYFAAIPDLYPFGYGRGTSLIQFLLGDAIGSSEALPVHMHVAAVTRGEYGTIVNGFFICDAWAEFGWVGIPILSFAAGLLVKWYDYRIARTHYPFVRAAMVAFALSASFTLATSAITTSLLTGGMVLIPIFAAWLERKNKIQTNSSCASSKTSLPTSPT